jgi:lipoyl synthase
VLSDTVRRIRAESPGTLVELLIGDLAEREESLRLLLESPPDVLAHNLETVRSISTEVRDPRAGYDRSLRLLRAARRLGSAALVTKSSIMLGLGETDSELVGALRDLRAADVDLLTLGQYLRPSAAHRPVHRFVPPEEFSQWQETAVSLGFLGAACGPLVRSSYHAEELYRSAHAARGA